MALVEISAQLTGAAGAFAQAGLRMGLEATIRRPKPPEGFGRPAQLPETPDAVQGHPGANNAQGK